MGRSKEGSPLNVVGSPPSAIGNEPKVVKAASLTTLHNPPSPQRHKIPSLIALHLGDLLGNRRRGGAL